MQSRNAATPWTKDSYIYFKLRSPKFVVFEFQQDGGVYEVPKFIPGTYRFHVDGIRKASKAAIKSEPQKLISVDMAQMFFVDQGFEKKFRDKLDNKKGMQPDFTYFARLRKKVGIDFGYIAAGMEPATYFDGDGTYILDIKRLEYVRDLRAALCEKKPKKSEREIALSVIKSMKTYICTRCLDEFNECAEEGWTAAWFRQMVEDSLHFGWKFKIGKGMFGDWIALCPKCAGKGSRKKK